MNLDQAQHDDWQSELKSGERFAFGANWREFLDTVTQAHIDEAVRGVQNCVGFERLDGLTFLDIGSGSGIHSLAAYLLGAEVHSFDFDTDSVSCTTRLRDKYQQSDQSWTVEQGSVLDRDFMMKLGKHDITYSWGVLHHTGDMWNAIDNSTLAVEDGGKFVLALYNDQGGMSRRWKTIKRAYVKGSPFTRAALLAGTAVYFETQYALSRALRGKNPLPFEDWNRKREERGMNPWHDLVDWVGGYPFEVAKPEEVFSFMKERGFSLDHMATVGSGHGCNEFTFIKG